MANEIPESDSTTEGWSSIHVYVMATICLVLGVALGYFFRGSKAPATEAPPRSAAQAQSPAQAGMAQQVPTMDQMKHMADTKVEPLLAQLKGDPNNTNLLKQIAKIYLSAHQFKDAADYYGRILETNPKDVETRSEMAACLFYNGDVDSALAQLQLALRYDPRNADSLFNLGMIRWKGKNDTAGALEAWNQLLQSNPQLGSDKKAQVEKLIAEARQGLTN